MQSIQHSCIQELCSMTHGLLRCKMNKARTAPAVFYSYEKHKQQSRVNVRSLGSQK